MIVNTFRTAHIALFSLFALASCQNSAENEASNDKEIPVTMEKTWLFIGTYTNGNQPDTAKSKGIYLYQMDSSGELALVSTAPFVHNPSYLAIHPQAKHLYAVNETGTFEDRKTGGVTAFGIDLNTGQFQLLNQVSSEGAYPCHISLVAGGNYALVANYGGGNVAMLPVNEDGTLGNASSTKQHEGNGPNASRQEAPHAHMILPEPGEKYAYAADLGTDKVYQYAIDGQDGSLDSIAVFEAISGGGPRHLTFHPTQPRAYLLHELTGKIQVMGFEKASGSLAALQVISSLKQGEDENLAGSADIHIHPSGKFLYASNRGAYNNIAIFEIDPASGQLTLIGHQSSKGIHPRNFAIDPQGKFLLVANKDSDNIVVFRIDAQSGLLQETGKELSIPNPVCLKFWPG